MAKKTAEVRECGWESGALGLSKEHAERVPVSHESEVDESLGLQLISIRLPKNLINELKFIASREGLGYQPLIRRVLQRFSAGEFRSMAREEFVTVSTPTEEVPDLDDTPMPVRKRA